MSQLSREMQAYLDSPEFSRWSREHFSPLHGTNAIYNLKYDDELACLGCRVAEGDWPEPVCPDDDPHHECSVCHGGYRPADRAEQFRQYREHFRVTDEEWKPGPSPA